MNRDESGLSGALLIATWTATTMFFWGFAFFHLPDSTPEWLIRAQSACFGTNESGLPDTYGWMLLVLAPISILLGMLVSLQQELRVGGNYIRSKCLGRKLIVITLALIVAETGWVASRIGKGLEIAYASYETVDNSGLPENYPSSSRPAPDFTLINQDGKAISISKLKGQNILLTFAFAHCSTICPVLVKNSMQAHSSLKENSTELLIVTLDPWRDTLSSLPTMAKKWNLGLHQHVLSGSIKEVEAVIASYGVITQRNTKNGDVVHPALTFVINAEGKLVYTFNGASVNWIVEALTRVQKGADVQ